MVDGVIAPFAGGHHAAIDAQDLVERESLMHASGCAGFHWISSAAFAAGVRRQTMLLFESQIIVVTGRYPVWSAGPVIPIGSPEVLKSTLVWRSALQGAPPGVPSGSVTQA